MSQQRSTAAYSAAARLERLPISGYHRVIFIIIAGAFFFDSIDLGMMTFVLGSIKQEFGLSTARRDCWPAPASWAWRPARRCPGCWPTGSAASRCSR